MNRQATEVIVVYFPSWHQDEHYQDWYGNGFSEWDLLKSAQPLFEGHHQPKRPDWGCFDESDPAWMEKQIDLAADHGITTFMFDWYWYDGVKFLHRPLEEGFLQAKNRERLKFFLMWANHDWGAWPAITGIPGMAGNANQGQHLWLSMTHSMEDCDRVIDYCSEQYFTQPNYWCINDRPVLALWSIQTFIDKLGGEERGAAGIHRMQERSRKNGLPGLHFIANIGCCDDNEYCCGWDRVGRARKLGFETVFAYNIVRTASFASIPNELPIVQYDEVIDSHRLCWKKIEAGGVPHFPSVTMGSDVTPRWHRGVTLPMNFRALKYEPIVVDNTPDKFGILMQMALQQAKNNTSGVSAVIVNAWNEWTEGMFLLPEKQYGSAYLEAVRQLTT